MRLLESLLRINKELNPQCAIERFRRQFQFYCCEVKSLIGQRLDPLEKIKLLLWFLFEHKKFQVRLSDYPQVLDHVLVEEILNKRQGSALPLAILFREISSEIGVKLDFVVCQGFRLLKFVHQGRSVFVDIVDRRILRAEDLIKFLNQHKQDPVEKIMSLFETTPPAQVLRGYLQTLKSCCRGRRFQRQLLRIYDLILENYPSSIRELGERALLLKNFGEDYLAQLDLRRYFTFVNREEAPQALRDLRPNPQLSVIDP